MSNQSNNRPETEQKARITANLPVLVGTPAPRPSLRRHDIPASFLSQLIAERGRFSVQRAKRRATSATAVSAYRSGAKVAQRRLPAGYGHTRIA